MIMDLQARVSGLEDILHDFLNLELANRKTQSD